MDSQLLVDEKFDDGKKLIDNLDKQGYRFPIALWMYNLEQNGWMLFFAVPDLRSIGAKIVYKRIHKIIIGNNLKHISVNDISLIDNRNELWRDLRSMVHIGSSLGKNVFFGNSINGRRFPDSIIYRVI